MNSKVVWLAAAAGGALVIILHTHYAFGQSTYFTGPMGEPRGQAWTSGNQTNITSETGVPLGSARSQYGAPPPASISVAPGSALGIAPIQPIQPIAPVQPIQPLR